MTTTPLQVIGFIAVHPDTGREYRYDRAVPVPPSVMDVLLVKDKVCQAFKRDFGVECADVLVA